MYTSTLMQRLPRPLDLPRMPSARLALPAPPMPDWRLSGLVLATVLVYVLLSRALLGRRLITKGGAVRVPALVEGAAVAAPEQLELTEKAREALGAAAVPPPARPMLLARLPLAAPALPAIPRLRLPTFDLSSKLLALLGDDEDLPAAAPPASPGSPGVWTINGSTYRLPGQAGAPPLVKIGPPPSGRRMSHAQSGSNGAWHPVRTHQRAQSMHDVRQALAPPPPALQQAPPAPAMSQTRHRRTVSAPTLALPRTPSHQISPTPPTLASPAYTVAQMGGYAGQGVPMSMAKLIMGRHSPRRPRGMRSYSIGVPSSLRIPSSV